MPGESTYDEGFIHTKYRLPITEMIFLQNHSSTGHANMTLGPLLCWGNGKVVVLNSLGYIAIDNFSPISPFCLSLKIIAISPFNYIFIYI